MTHVPKILIIAGSDPSGGAGIQADIKTASAHDVYSSAVITCLTAQNTQGVSAIHHPPIDFLRRQLCEVLDDIAFDAIKIGMLGTSEIIQCVSEILDQKDKAIPVLLDSVMVSTSGDLLLEENAVEDLKKELLSKAYIVTPNIDEAQVLANMSISNLRDMKKAALIIQNCGAKRVLIKGGHLQSSRQMIQNILLDADGLFYLIENKRIEVGNIHGTGCSLASAIASNLAKKMDIVTSVRHANRYVSRCIKKGSNLGKGSRVLYHF